MITEETVAKVLSDALDKIALASRDGDTGAAVEALASVYKAGFERGLDQGHADAIGLLVKRKAAPSSSPAQE